MKSSKIAKRLILLVAISNFMLILFTNFYTYSNLTRFVYSMEWLLAKCPFLLSPKGELVIPPIVSLAFRHFHSMKAFISHFCSQIWPDGYPDFYGKYHWGSQELAQCANGQELFKGQGSDPLLKCHIYRIYLSPVNVEVLNINPPIVKYHQFLPSSHVQQFIEESEKRPFTPSKILVKDSLDQDIWQDSLVVNSTAMHHRFSHKIAHIFDFIQHRIRAFNLQRAEHFHIKYYQPGGHYAPHLDYVVFDTDRALGNRIASFMVILKSAKRGGGTIFPNAGVHFQPQPGDALLWLNMHPNYEVAHDSLHGACPVLDGVKMGVTLWIRSVGQELRMPCPLHANLPFDLRYLVRPTQLRPRLYFWTYAECAKEFLQKQEIVPKICRDFKMKHYWGI